MTVDLKYYSVQLAAQTLDVDDEQVLDFIHAGQLRAVNMAKANSKRPRWRIGESDLGRFLLSRVHPACNSTPAAKTSRRRDPSQHV